MVGFKSAKRVAVIGAGWAGLAAAVSAVQGGHQVTLFEASRNLGGRARAVEVQLPSGQLVMLDNGQHVLLGVYRETLTLMETVGIDLAASLTRQPVSLGLLQTKAWDLRDYFSLLSCVAGWGLQGFSCPEGTTVADLCKNASPRVMADVFASLCLSALNTAPEDASGRVFLRVLKDAFWGKAYVHVQGHYKSSDMLIPKVDLGRLLPDRVALWLQGRGTAVRLGERVSSLSLVQTQWHVNDDVFDAVVVATPPSEAARLLKDIVPDWAATVDALEYRAIATVYAQAPCGFDLKAPLRALFCGTSRPAQFVFQRRESKGLLAFVVSDAKHNREELEMLVLAQGEAALGVPLQPVTTIIEKRATFACRAGMKKPAKLKLAGSNSFAGLSVVGDYMDDAYPATIEAAVRSTL